MTSKEWVDILTPVVGPVLTALAKKFAPKIPPSWVPLIAIVLGAAANLIGVKTIANGEPNVLSAALLGLAGIGVYETTKPITKGAKAAAVPLIAFLCFFGLPAHAAPAPAAIPAPVVEKYYGSEVSADLFAGYGTTDFNEGIGFTGFGVNYYLNDNLGVGASTSFNSFSGRFFDNVSLKGLYRIPIGKNAIYGFAGGLRELDQDKWGLTIGGGVERRIAKYLSLYGEVAMEKFSDIDPVAVGKIGIRIPLSLHK